MAKKLISKQNEDSTHVISEIQVATILFISINHFYEWVEAHPSQDIINLLETVFVSLI
jgi:hypothetical protein